MTRIAFMDTETTGLGLDDDIWEFAAIVREPDGTETGHHMFIQHDTQRCNALPTVPRRRAEGGHVTAIEIPEHLPLTMQDIDIMRCVTCGDILVGAWKITKQATYDGIDHYLERHLEDTVADRYPRPPFVNCDVQDPFWFDEHAGEAP